ncbi:uncharacterized protein C12orf42 homolog [Panthera leo]|uniref:uncharacterized protein C12orf42 homolog n=1 Tax=Panthera leo TaxID=9689 RepID=UPI001C69E1A8|nr:uncharacterized protein C12orf42 homolog [Panthera leo]
MAYSPKTLNYNVLVSSENTGRVFAGKVQTPGACRRLLCAQQYSIPRSPAVSTAFSEEESHGEASFSQTPSSEWDETRLIFAVRQEMKKRARGAPNAAWSRPLLEKSMTKKPIRPSHSVAPDNDNDSDNDNDNYYYHDRFIPHLTSSHHVPYTVLSISHYFMKASYNTFRQVPLRGLPAPQASAGEARPRWPRRGVSQSPPEPKLEDRVADAVVALADPPLQSRPWGASGSPGGWGARLPWHWRCSPSILIRGKGGRGEKRVPKADASLHGNLAGAPVPLPAGAPTHLPSKRLIKAPPRPRVNAPLH